MAVKVDISDDFDGGNIQYMDQKANEQDPTVLDVIVHIKPDVRTELEQIAHMQYFSFCAAVSGLEQGGPQKVKYIIANAHAVSYPEAWTGSTVFYTDAEVTDVDSWKRNQDTFYTTGHLSWEHLHMGNGKVYFSYFPPFCYQRHLDLIAKCSEVTTVLTLGHSLQGRAIECVTAGTGAQTCWIIHRQHPGETMAEHYAEGLLYRLLGLDGKDADPVAQRLLQLYSFYIVPCMCPDGAVMGHLRTNSAGANLNREWATVKSTYEAPTLERSPEVHCVRGKMDETGVDCFLDIHGDEELPFNFMVGANHIPNWSPRLESLLGAFIAAYTRNNSDMQQKIGYPPRDDPAEVIKYMNVAVNQVANRFECLAITLEMPFKDCRSNPDPEFGWSPCRSRKLGASVLEALEYVHPHLRGDSWMQFPPEDEYIKTTDDYETHDDQGAEVNDLPQFQMLKKRFYSDVHEIHKVHQFTR